MPTKRNILSKRKILWPNRRIKPIAEQNHTYHQNKDNASPADHGHIFWIQKIFK